MRIKILFGIVVLAMALCLTGPAHADEGDDILTNIGSSITTLSFNG